jgi:hypothetical protein
MKILIQNEIFAERSDMSEQITGQVQKTLLESSERSGISGDQNRIVWFVKLDTLILTAMRIKRKFRENLRS